MRTISVLNTETQVYSEWEHNNRRDLLSISAFSSVFCLSPATFRGILGCSRLHTGWIFLRNLSWWLPQRLGLLPSSDCSCLLLLLHELLGLSDSPSFLKQHETLTFGGSKLSDCPSCLAQPHPLCLWVSKKEFFCCFRALALSFSASFRHLLISALAAGFLPAGSCIHTPDGFPSSGLSFTQCRAGTARATGNPLPSRWKGPGETQHSVHRLTDSIPLPPTWSGERGGSADWL